MAEQKDDKVAWVRLVFGVVFIGFLISLVPYSVGDSWAERGQVGDMFGVVNTFFSGLAFVGLLVAIFLQRKELSLQREELKLTRKELAGSSAALRKQHEAQLVAIKLTAIGSEIAQCDRAMKILHEDGNTASFDHVDSIRSNLFRQQKKLYGELGITSWDSEE